MSKIENLLPDYIDIDDEEAIESYMYKLELQELIDKGEFLDNSLLREFLEDILPYKGPNHFIMVSDKEGRTKNIAYSREECINALCCLSQYELTLYYHPATFTEWIENKYAVAFRSLVVDIDDVGLIADETSYEDVVNFLQNEIGLTPDQFPKWCSLSGHGMHLIFPTDEYTADDENLRVKYLESLIVLAGGDISGKPIAHMFRCPCSFNLKERPIKGKLFKMNDSTDRDIHRLDWCLKYRENYEEYRIKCNQARNEKREKTIERKKKEEAELLERLGDESLVDFLGRTNISEKDKEVARRILKRNLKRKAKNKAKGKFADEIDEALIINDDSDDIYFDDDDFEDTLYYDNPLPYKHLEFYNNHHKNNRTWNFLLDMHNFFIRHKGCLLSRNMYFFIIACFIKQIGHDEDYAVRYCYRYVDADYYNEMEYIVGSVYHSKKEYRFKYSTVADILGFTEEDYERSYCCYTEAQRKARKKEQNKKSYANRKEKAGKTPAQLKKESQIEFVRNNINLPDADLMKALGVSRSTVQRLKKKI